MSVKMTYTTLQVGIFAFTIVLFAAAELDRCPRGGQKCGVGNSVKDDCVVGRSHCCVYDVPTPTSRRCLCKAGYAGNKCQMTLDDVDFNKAAKDDVKRILQKRVNPGVAKNVVLLIGDGMSLATIAAARIYDGQNKNKPGEETAFSFEGFPYVGLSKTCNWNTQVTDSAAAASAMFSGQKVNYGTLGVNKNVLRYDCESEKDNKVDTIMDWSQAAGKRTGFVTTTRVTHATPAALYAKTCSRDWESDADYQDRFGNDWQPLAEQHNCTDIAWQFVHSKPGMDINVALGGGRAKLLPNTENDPEVPTAKGSRKDGRNLVKEWQSLRENNDESAEYVWNKQQFDDINTKDTDYLLGLFERSHLKYNIDTQNDAAKDPTLAEMAETAIKILDKGDEGYFLLVEGGRIDHGHHAGLAVKALDETIEFNKAVEKVLELTDDKDTLVMVTADHSHVFTMGGYTSRGNPILGFVDTIELEPSRDGMPRTTLAYADGPGGSNRTARVSQEGEDYNATSFMHHAAVFTNEETHGGEDVAMYASGPMAHLFTGVHDQYYVAHAVAYASCVGANMDHCDKEEDKEKPLPCGTGKLQAAGVLNIIVVFLITITNI